MLSNITPVPNLVFDIHLKDLKIAEIKVLLVIIRMTLGWEDKRNKSERKEVDWISSSQLQEKTGCCGRAITSAIEILMAKNLIEILDEKGNVLGRAEKRKGKTRMYYRLSPTVNYYVEKTVEKYQTSANNSPDLSKEIQNPQQNLLITKETSQKNLLQNNFLLKNSTNQTQMKYTIKNFPYTTEQLKFFAGEIIEAGGIDELMIEKKALKAEGSGTVITSIQDLEFYKTYFLTGVYEPLREIYKTHIPYVFWGCVYNAMEKAGIKI